jgi:hypothetical protein
MARLSISQAWDESRHILTKDGGLLSAVALALLVLPRIITGLVAPSPEHVPGGAAYGLSFIAFFIAVIGQLAIIRLALGPSTSVGQAIAHGVRRFPPTFLSLLLLGVICFVILVPLVAVMMAAGMIDAAGKPTGSGALPILLFAAALLFLSVKLMLTIPVSSAEQVGPLTILKRSWKLTNGHYLPLLGLTLMLLLLAVVLISAAGAAGYVVAELIGGEVKPYSLSALLLAIVMGHAEATFTVIGWVMLARVYAQLAGRDASASGPSSGT